MRQSQAPRGLLSLRNEMQVDSCGVTRSLVAPAAQARRSASPTLPGEELPGPGAPATPPPPGPTTDSCRPKTTIVRNSGLTVGQGSIYYFTKDLEFLGSLPLGISLLCPWEQYRRPRLVPRVGVTRRDAAGFTRERITLLPSTGTFFKLSL